MNTTTYASKSAAKKGAARKNLKVGDVQFVKDDNGRWTWTQDETSGITVTAGPSMFAPAVNILRTKEVDTETETVDTETEVDTEVDTETETEVDTDTETVKPKQAKKASTKSSIVRERIAQAKDAGEEKTVVVEYAITELNMSKALARAYVKNNW